MINHNQTKKKGTYFYSYEWLLSVFSIILATYLENNEILLYIYTDKHKNGKYD